MNKFYTYRVKLMQPDTAVGDPSPGTVLHNGKAYLPKTREIISYSEQGALAEAQTAGCIILSVGKVDQRWQIHIIGKDYKAQFLQAIAFNTEAGMSAGQALEESIRSEQDVDLRMRLNPGLIILSRGGSFSEAMSHLRLYDEATLAILASGEKTGNMNQALRAAINNYTDRLANWKNIVGVLTLLGADIIATVSSIFAIQYKFIPDLENVGITGEKTPERIQAFAETIQTGYWMNGIMLWLTIILSMMIISTIFTYFISGSEKLKRGIESIIYRIPVVAQYIRDTGLSSSFSVMGSMVSGGVNFTTAVTIAKRTSAFPSVRNYWDIVERRIFSGDSLIRALNQDMLTSSEHVLISSHKSMAQLATIFEHITKNRIASANKWNSRLRSFLIWGVLLYASASVLIYLWLLKVQNEGIMGQVSGAM